MGDAKLAGATLTDINICYRTEDIVKDQLAGLVGLTRLTGVSLAGLKSAQKHLDRRTSTALKKAASLRTRAAVAAGESAIQDSKSRFFCELFKLSFKMIIELSACLLQLANNSMAPT